MATEVDPGAGAASLSQRAIYIITRGQAELLTGANNSRAVTAGDTIYIQKTVGTASRTSVTPWLNYLDFPTDTWQEVRYIFANEKLN